MEVRIIEERENPLLWRKEYFFEVLHPNEATPKKSEVAKVLSAKLNVPLELMSIKNYRSRFGMNLASGVLYVYESEEKLKLVEGKKANLKKRLGISEEELKGEEKEEAKEGGEGGEAQG